MITASARRSWTVWLGLSIAAWMQLRRGLEGQPSELATHFGISGAADSWMSHSSFMALQIALWLCVTLCFWGSRYLLSLVPAELISLPERDYWLDPSRRAETMAKIAAWMESLGLVTLLFLMGINQSLFEANRLPEPRLGTSFFVALCLYFGCTVAWAVALFRVFRRPLGD